MKTINEIDKNFSFNTTLSEKDIKYYNAAEKPFRIYGLYKPSAEKPFCRLSPETAQGVNDGVRDLNYNTAGGRIRFKTNSKYIAIRPVISYVCHMPHMTSIGSTGFDFYEKVDGNYYFRGIFGGMPEQIKKDGGYENIHYFEDEKMRDITINFPLYNPVDAVYIGVQEGAQLLSGDEYARSLPFVYYGSSITQGGCASRPGNSYQAIISRYFDVDYINLGFSGSARGEDKIAEYIAALPMSIFVYDYDHNAPTADSLRATHQRMFKTIRAKNPDLPIIMLSRPKLQLNAEESERRKIIYKTYTEAVNSGDRNVYFIDGTEIFKAFGGDGCTVDNCHPNDLGFACMAEAVKGVIEKITGKPRKD